ncbi:CoA pyrophosphatase [Hyphomicrobiales bacterium]|jgi:8-oxo-dGTP pyrophosphatase MutT (NUDIX family)|nr:CoA pyrophosphatase [Rhodobiaceae bacterium]MDB4831864.1 CoA pyrophosphatase [Hyphomicrobiales bacterium]MDC0139264.1 CoA pyrophosphatase [Hyphomicrobiales bacterium]MDC3272324.1 CoA pyrophosphatase [Hyphomicrobiales bacterium]|tara:strand:- start:25 stop:654 length:630 start_codon:yes stop_codon:yes gene_type:complete
MNKLTNIIDESLKDKLNKNPPIFNSIFENRNKLITSKLNTEYNGRIFKHSAILLILKKINGSYHIILTVRSDQMPSHAGQISFPGGKVDLKDKTLTDTAIREANEEIGIQNHELEIMGYLDICMTGTDYLIAPVIALSSNKFEPVIDKREVNSLFTIPLSFINNVNNLELHTKIFNGVKRNFFVYNYMNYFIWGATARILKDFNEKVLT